MAQQTALNWFLDQLPKNVQVALINTSVDAVNKAREMEKEQIIEAFDIGCTDENRIGKEYYNETYKK